jgi:hypothetical protein
VIALGQSPPITGGCRDRCRARRNLTARSARRAAALWNQVRLRFEPTQLHMKLKNELQLELVCTSSLLAPKPYCALSRPTSRVGQDIPEIPGFRRSPPRHALCQPGGKQTNPTCVPPPDDPVFRIRCRPFSNTLCISPELPGKLKLRSGCFALVLLSTLQTGG